MDLLQHERLDTADEIAEPRPDMNIKVAAFTVSEKSINTNEHALTPRISDSQFLTLGISYFTMCMLGGGVVASPRSDIRDYDQRALCDRDYRCSLDNPNTSIHVVNRCSNTFKDSFVMNKIPSDASEKEGSEAETLFNELSSLFGEINISDVKVENQNNSPEGADLDPVYDQNVLFDLQNAASDEQKLTVTNSLEAKYLSDLDIFFDESNSPCKQESSNFLSAFDGLFDESDSSPSTPNTQDQQRDRLSGFDRSDIKNNCPGLFEDSSSSEDEDLLSLFLFGDDEPSNVKHNSNNSKHGLNKHKVSTKPTNFLEQSSTTKNRDINSEKSETRPFLEATNIHVNRDSSVDRPELEDRMDSRPIVKRSDSEIDWCVICMDGFSKPKILHKCSHKFCEECIDEYFKVRPQCPVCFVAYGVITGIQPKNGDMSHSVNNRLKLPGYEAHKTIVVHYSFRDGVQTDEHPNPGQTYYGTSRTAYLPDNDEGRLVLKLLKKAFERRLVFTVGRSRTTGADNQVTWNDIHHKTCTSGGQQGFGYPDPTYLTRVQEELAAFGVTADCL